MNACQTNGCRRAPRQSSSGIVAAYCDAHLRAILRDAFAPEPPASWHALARAHRLPPLIVGGVSA